MIHASVQTSHRDTRKAVDPRPRLLIVPLLASCPGLASGADSLMQDTNCAGTYDDMVTHPLRSGGSHSRADDISPATSPGKPTLPPVYPASKDCRDPATYIVMVPGTQGLEVPFERSRISNLAF